MSLEQAINKSLVAVCLLCLLSCRDRGVIFVTQDGSGDTRDTDVDSGDAMQDEMEDETLLDMPGDEADMADIDVSDATEPDLISDPPDLEILEKEPIRPSREPRPCGEGCRQVSFTELNVGHYIDVWDNYLAVSVSGSYGRNDRVWLIDLATLDHYVIAETDHHDTCQPCVAIPTIHEETLAFGFHTRCESTEKRCQFFIFDIDRWSAESVYSRMFEGACPSRLNIFGTYLAWWDGRVPTTFGGQAFLFNMETAEERLLSPDGCCATSTHMYGNYVAWEQGIPGNGKQIWVHDIHENESFRVSEGNREKYSPHVYMNTVLWTECFVDGCDKYTGKSADIVMKDLDTGDIVKITDNEHMTGGPVMWGDVVAWSDCRNDPVNSAECLHRAWDGTREWDVYMKYLTTGEESQVTGLPGSEVVMAIYENKIYFVASDKEGILSVFEVTIGA